MMAWQALQPGSSYPSYPTQPGRKPSIACPSTSIMSIEDTCEKRNEQMITERTGRRQWNRIADVAAIGVAIGFIAFLTQHPTAGFDLWGAYAPAASGDVSNIYNPYWALPLFELLGKVPFGLAYSALMLWSLVAIIVSTQVYGGRLVFALLTYQFGTLLYFGQIDGLVVLGMATSWWALKNHRPWLVGIGFVLASIKPQMSVAALLLIWWWLDRPGKIRSLAIPFLVILGSFLLYGCWVPEWLNRVQTQDPVRGGSITLWEYFGPIVLLLWLPALLTRLPRQEKLLLFLATSAITMPYFQQVSLLVLQVFPIGWIAWIGNIGFLHPMFHEQILEWIVLLPLSVYIWLVWTGIHRSHRGRPQPSG